MYVFTALYIDSSQIQKKITDSNAKSNIKILIKVYLKSGNSARYK